MILSNCEIVEIHQQFQNLIAAAQKLIGCSMPIWVVMWVLKGNSLLGYVNVVLFPSDVRVYSIH